MEEDGGGEGREDPSRNEKTRENLFLQTTAAFSALLISINVALRKSAGTTVIASSKHTHTHTRHRKLYLSLPV